MTLLDLPRERHPMFYYVDGTVTFLVGFHFHFLNHGGMLIANQKPRLEGSRVNARNTIQAIPRSPCKTVTSIRGNAIPTSG